MRILVAIANYGRGRPLMVERLIAGYNALPHDVDIVLMSDRARPAIVGAEVLVGTPTDNPYSLPFAHRPLFRDRRSDYDLFVYSEDDTQLTMPILDRWLELNQVLPRNTVPGLIRYEENNSGGRSYPSFHSAFHWRTDTIAEIGGELVAEYSNLHSALYMMDRGALDIALASGNFDVRPHSGRYDMLVMAGTGPFMNCGLTRVLPLRRLRELALHHMPNDYVGVLGIDDAALQRQLDACIDVHAGLRICGQLFPIETKLDEFTYDKMVYEQVLKAIPAAIPAAAKTVLTVGAGMGLLERQLSNKYQVASIPIDAIAQAELEHLGIRATAPCLDLALDELEGTEFDALVMSNILHRVPNPKEWLSRLIPLAPDGTVVASVPESSVYRARAIAQAVQRSAGLRGHRMSKLRPPPRQPYSDSLLHVSGKRWLARRMRAAGVRQLRATREQEVPPIITDRYTPSRLGRLLPSHVIVFGSVGTEHN